MQVRSHANQSHVHKNGFALRLVLKQRHKETRKWSIPNEKPENLAAVIRGFQNMQNLVFLRCCCVKDGKEMYKDLKRTCTAIVLLIKPVVWRGSHCRRRRGLFKFSIRAWSNGPLKPMTVDSLLTIINYHQLSFIGSNGQRSS